jgi:hypothetical protein
MAFNNNLFSWLAGSSAGGSKGREMQETRASWQRVENEWRRSPLASLDLEDLADAIVHEALRNEARAPNDAVSEALYKATEQLLRAETLTDIEPLWGAIEGRMEVAVEFRDMLSRRSLWSTQYARLLKVYSSRLGGAYRQFVGAFPEACFREDEGGDTFDVPLIDLLSHPAETIEDLIRFPFDDEVLALKLFNELRVYLRKNLMIASGQEPVSMVRGSPKIVRPTDQDGMSARELAELYLGGTPFADLLELPVPFEIPQGIRFEHCHIIGGTGHGKTQLLQKMIHADLVASQHDRRSVVVIDSQGDLIKKLSRLELFSPFVGGGLGERLVLIDSSDVEHPAALNLFDAHLNRIRAYSPADRERVLNGVIELYETFFDALLGAELTQRQDVVFRYIARLMLTIPGATIHTLMELMDKGHTFKPYMEKLDGSAKRFFETEFFSPSFSATKGQIQKRLWGVLSTPAFERMFAQKENKLDLFEAMNEGKIILVNTAKDLLKDDGSKLFGRFFIAMLAQATLERSTISEAKRTPTFVYVDEAHEYFDDRIETILNQARKFKVGLTLAHQNLDQLSPRLRATLITNTSVKCAGGTSAKDAHALAPELHTTSEFIDAMRRKGPKTEFAVWVKHQTPSAVRLSVPLGFLERQHTLDDEDYDELLKRNRERYCGTIAELPSATLAEDDAPIAIAQQEPKRDTQTETVAPPDAKLKAPPRPPSTPAPRAELAARVTPAKPGHEYGKGGPKHRYLQTLVKGLAETIGLKATIEAPLPHGGQVDVLLERDGVIAAIEISVSTPVEHESENIKKCLVAGFRRIVVVLAKPKPMQNAFRQTLLGMIAEGDRERVSILTPEEVPAYIAALAPKTAPTERIIKGYRVKSGTVAATPEEAQARRDAIGRIIAQSISEKGRLT